MHLEFLHTGNHTEEILHRAAVAGKRMTLELGEVYDDICIITDDEALDTSRRLAREEGMMCGISSGTNVACAIKLAMKLGPGKTVVTVLPDTAERYFSTPLFQD